MHKFTNFIKEFTPAEASFLIRFRPTVDLNIILATIIDLAIKGFIKKIKIEDIFLGANVEIEKNENSDFTKLKKHERYLFEALFKKGNKSIIQNLKKTFKRSKFRKNILKELQEKNLLNKNFRIFNILFNILIVINFFLLIISFFVFSSKKFILFLILIIIIILLMLFNSYFIPKGLLINKKFSKIADDFKMTILNTSKKDLEKLLSDNPNIFFDILPFAISFQIEKEWIKKFKELNIPFSYPKWYYSVIPRKNFLETLENDIKGMLKTLSAMYHYY